MPKQRDQELAQLRETLNERGFKADNLCKAQASKLKKATSFARAEGYKEIYARRGGGPLFKKFERALIPALILAGFVQIIMCFEVLFVGACAVICFMPAYILFSRDQRNCQSRCEHAQNDWWAEYQLAWMFFMIDAAAALGFVATRGSLSMRKAKED